MPKIDTKNRMKYVLEFEKGSYHLHFITTFGKLKQLKKLIKGYPPGHEHLLR